MKKYTEFINESALYKLKTPNDDIIEFIGEINLRNYINIINKELKYHDRISLEKLIRLGDTRNYTILFKLKINKKIKGLT